MEFHTFPVERADALEDPSRYRFLSRDELVELLDPDPEAVVADLGSGTGFYAADLAPFVGTLYAVDVQPAMHDLHRENGVPETVELVTAVVSALPLPDDELDGAFSVMTHHEYGDAEALAELARVCKPGARIVTVDWSADGVGEDGPSMEERFDASTVADDFARAGFTVEAVHDRPETFVVVVRR